MFDRRKVFFIKKKFQLHYIVFVFLAMLLTTVICVGGIYYLIWQTVAKEFAVPELIEDVLIPALGKANMVLLVALPLAFLLMLLLSVFVSHKIAGPIYRTERDLDEIVKGDYARRIKLRDGDDLQELADGINKLLDHFMKGK
jgi:signal transduction histidine kinase